VRLWVPLPLGETGDNSPSLLPSGSSSESELLLLLLLLQLLSSKDRIAAGLSTVQGDSIER
jgi:hypothetical protein